MSETAAKLFQAVKAATNTVAPGLKDLVPETKAEFSRLGTQGSAELAQALFGHSNAYVPYGPGQRAPNDHDHQRGGMSR
ncbi:MAG TPA: hypothetical protein VHQ47_06075 [Phycisphaerae bacterium]|jgi:hypothetical protein|nr:hypothetical protein [Phycisphaerae bacterium]